MHLSTPPSEGAFGALCVGVTPCGALHHAWSPWLTKVCLRTKTTKRSMPFAFLLSGSQALQVLRLRHGLDAVLAFCAKPLLTRWLRNLAVLWTFCLLYCQVHRSVLCCLVPCRVTWRFLNSCSSYRHLLGVPRPVRGTSVCTHSALGRQLHLSKALRRIQGHHRLSGAHLSIN